MNQFTQNKTSKIQKRFPWNGYGELLNRTRDTFTMIESSIAHERQLALLAGWIGVG